MVAPNMWGSSVWNLLLITLLASTVVMWLLDFLGKFVCPYSIVQFIKSCKCL